MILGVDVWDGYGRIDWAKVAAAGVKFAIVRARIGNNGRDGRVAENIAGAKAAGLYVGAYLYGFPLPTHPSHPGREPRDQARRFFDEANGLGRGEGELPPALDIEWPVRFDKRKLDTQGNPIDQWRHWGVDAASIAEWTLACLAELERLSGRVPMLYTFPDFWRSLGDVGADPAFARYPLWIATYRERSSRSWMPVTGDSPLLPRPWTTWTFWQFSADGSPIRIPGIERRPVDRNVFGGTLAELAEIANTIEPSAGAAPAIAAFAAPTPTNERDLMDNDIEFDISVDIEVAWGEMDAFSHVNNAVFLRWFETARIAWFEKVGFPEQKGQNGPVLRTAKVEFKAPVEFPDTVSVRVRAEKMGRSSVTLTYEVWSAKAKVTVATGETVVVFFDFEQKASLALPDHARQRIQVRPPALTAETDIVSLLVAHEETHLRALTLHNVDVPNGPNGALSYKSAKVFAYAEQYCGQGNDCPDIEFEYDCTHFLCHCLAATGVRVREPSATCRKNLCIRVNDLAAAFSAATRYPNVKRLNGHAETRRGDFCFIPTWFGLRKEHGMLLAAPATAQGAQVFAHTNNRCGAHVSFAGADCIYYRIEDA